VRGKEGTGGLMAESIVVFSESELRKFSQQLLEAEGVPEMKAGLVAESLLAGSLRGVDSHGVQLLTFYLEQLEAGDVNPHAEGHVVSESAGCLLYDGENGLGQVVSDICCAHAVRLVREHGISLVVAHDSNHFGAAAFWGRKISTAGAIGIVMCNASPIVPTWQGREPRVGTNPICMSVPGGSDKSWLLDMATTTVAAGKIFKAAMNQQPAIPPGWALDSTGSPTTDTQAAFKGMLMPLGGYKGSGLAMMVEILCAVLGGGAMSTSVGGIRIRGRPTRVSQMFLAIDVARFLPLEEFQNRLAQLVATVKSAAPAVGYGEVLVAGEPEWRAEEIRRQQGIPVTTGVWARLVAAAKRLGVEIPREERSAISKSAVDAPLPEEPEE
jgi:LDH2 family malate/lactate/ureidoglycolate dehydrogenase